MSDINTMAENYVKSTLVGSPYIKKTSYIEGAKDVLREVMNTISVSEDEYLKNNLQELIRELKGDLCLNETSTDDVLKF
jgi:hypothetical protein